MDLKRILAYATISALGLMTLLLGDDAVQFASENGAETPETQGASLPDVGPATAP